MWNRSARSAASGSCVRSASTTAACRSTISTKRMMRLRNRQERRRRQAHAIPDLLKQTVARRLDNREVEREVRFDGAAMIAAGGGGAHRREETFELLQRRRVDPRRRVACRETFEDRTDRIELHELLDRNLADDRAAKRRAHDETRAGRGRAAPRGRAPD